MLWLISFGPGEVAKWHQAAAKNAWDDKRFADVISSADKGLQWDPANQQLLGLRAAARLQMDDLTGSLDDYDQLIDSAADEGSTTERQVQALAVRTQVLQRLGRYQDAVDTWDRIVEYRREQYDLRGDSESQRDFALSLNNRAYTKGLGRIDITGALDDIDRALEVTGRDDDPVMIDTLGYLLFLDEQYEQAKFYLEQAETAAKLQTDARRELLRQAMSRVTDQRPFEAELKMLDEQYSIILHHRGEVYAAIGDTEQAEADIAEAKRLGYNPDKGVW